MYNTEDDYTRLSAELNDVFGDIMKQRSILLYIKTLMANHG